MARPIRLESPTEAEARCVASVLAAHETEGPYEQNGVWIVDVPVNGHDDKLLEDVVGAVLACFADGRISGFTLDADGHRIPVGFAPPRG